MTSTPSTPHTVRVDSTAAGGPPPARGADEASVGRTPAAAPGDDHPTRHPIVDSGHGTDRIDYQLGADLVHPVGGKSLHPERETRLEHTVAALKPKLRGWLHFGAAPLAFVLGLALLVVTPTQGMRAAVAVYVLTTVLLFGVSAAYHLGAGRPRVNAFLRQLDHANIYLFIAGSYTPFAASLPDAGQRWLILGLVWGIAVTGLIIRVAWLGAPRWLVTASYLALGWVAVFFLPTFWSAFAPSTVLLLVLGGVLYSIGAVIYARKRPNPSPAWFGFHELFHAFTIAAYLVQFVAVAQVATG